tara:strand:- start:481 stop:843 length:363 start_codon:yes stop_codon:yes gene_type:complete
MPEEVSSIYTLLIAIVTAITSAKGWEYWLKRLDIKEKEKDKSAQEKNLFRDDLLLRVGALQEKLDSSYKKIESMSERINELSINLAKAEIRIEFLEHENSDLLKYKANGSHSIKPEAVVK